MADDVLMHIGASDFEERVLRSPLPVLVDFWAPWCGPCRAIAPAIDAVARQFAGRARVAKLDVDQSPAIAQQYGIRSIPALIVFRDGVPVAHAVGAISRGAIAELISRELP